MILGNTLSNLCNNGLAAIYNKDIFFVNVYRGEDLYRVCGKMYSQITDDKVKGLNIINDKIYYITLLGELKVVDVNGEENRKLLEGPIESAYVSDEYIFYINVLDNYSIYRYNLKNAEIKKICNNICDKLNVVGEDIYYIKCSDDLDWYGTGSIHKIDIEGKDSGEILKVATSNLIADNIYLYYTSEEENHKLYRFNIKTKKIEQITDNTVGSFSILDNEIYYANLSDEGKLYKVTNEGNNIKVSDDMPENINIVGEYIYFANRAYGYPYRLYRMKLNGEGKQMI